MSLKSDFQFLAAALAAAVVLAFPQPCAAQAYSDSFEGATINSWWTQPGNLPFAISTVQKHTGSQSIVAVGSNADFGGYELMHVFSGAVRGDFSVWVYDDTVPATVKFVAQELQLGNAASTTDAVISLSGASGYIAVTGSDSCALGSKAASPEWRRLRAIVRDTEIAFQVENGSGMLAACTVPYTAPLTVVALKVSGDVVDAVPPYAQVYLDDFSYTPAGGGYTVSLLYDPLKAAKSGSTIPIKLQLMSGGVNVSDPSLVVHAVGVLKVSDSASSVVADAGNANPDFDFRYDASLAGYIFNLKTTGLTTGTYNLKFQVNGLGDYAAPFAVR